MKPINDPNNQQSADSNLDKIPLFEEKLLVNHHQQKVGEIVIRKQVETRMVQVPIKREKLIVERIGKDPELLTAVITKEDKVNGFSFEELRNNNNLYSTKSKYLELSTAQELLDVIAHLGSADKVMVRLEIATNCLERQIKHQNICDQY